MVYSYLNTRQIVTMLSGYKTATLPKNASKTFVPVTTLGVDTCVLQSEDPNVVLEIGYDKLIYIHALTKNHCVYTYMV